MALAGLQLLLLQMPVHPLRGKLSEVCESESQQLSASTELSEETVAVTASGVSCFSLHAAVAVG